MLQNSHLSSPSLAQFDPEISHLMRAELARQEYGIELIASENFASEKVMQAQGSVLTNKYAEGYPGKRYYGGCVNVDGVEELAIERVKRLYDASYANVQPHSGSQANTAVFQAFCNPGDIILGMDLAHGGHLTHGSPVNFSGRLYNAVHYGVDADGLLDYEQMQRLASEHRPKMIIAGFSAYSRQLDWSIFRDIADSVGARLLVDMAHVSGLIAAGLYPNPIPYADAVTSTTHKTLRGPRGGIILSRDNEEIAKLLNARIFPGNQGGPLMHVIAAKAVAFKEALQPEFKIYQQQVINNAKAMVKVLVGRGLEIVSGGTDIHMFLLSLVAKNLTGKQVDSWLEQAHITVNKNSVPNDPQSPFITSGIRIGTPAITTRGFKEAESEQIGHWIADIIDSRGEANILSKVRHEVKQMCQSFPLYSQS